MRRLSFERFEERTLLANVAIAPSIDTLMLTGQGDNARFEIRSVAAGLSITALDANTTINGQVGPIVIALPQTTLLIKSTGANADVRLTDLVMNGNLTIRTDGSTSRVALTDVQVNGPFSVNDRDGALDLTVVDSAFTQGLSIAADGGRDVVKLLAATIAGYASINAGAGDDDVLIQKTTIKGTTNIDAGSGDDHVCMLESTFEHLNVNVGRGDDRVDLAASTVVYVATIEGDQGVDVLGLAASNQINRLTQRRIEQQTDVVDCFSETIPSGGGDAGGTLDEFLLSDALRLVGVAPNAFNPTSAPLQFKLTGASFLQNPNEMQLKINGVPALASSLAVTADTITATSVLADGKNEISLAAVDTAGRPLYLKSTIWAGSSTLRVNLVSANGIPFIDPATVVARLSDDQSVLAQAVSTGSFVDFLNVPTRTILIRATASGNRSGFAGVVGNEGFVQVTMTGLGAPSPIDNNDFSQGTAGWNIGSAPVQVLPHLETLSPQIGGFTLTPEHLNALNILAAAQRPPRGEASDSEFDASNLFSNSLLAASLVDNDLTLHTVGEGEQSISRTFTTEQGTTAVRIRYRFITTEVPGGFFGSQFNDYFRVSLRSQQGAGFAGEHNSMNGLGLAAFDFGSGATNWREVTLNVSPQGDTIQVDVGVANVGDDLFDSRVVIDFVEEVRDQVRPTLAWNNTQGGIDLRYAVENGSLNQAATIEVYWASGPGSADRIGAPIFSHAVPAGTGQGQHGPVRINGDLLAGDPPGATHLIAVASSTSVGSLADVDVDYGPHANQDVLNATLLDIIKDSARAGGLASVFISSTARTAADQARAMFQNLVNAGADGQLTLEEVASNVNVQQNGNGGDFTGYGAAGDAVINTFVSSIAGLTPGQILANQTQIRAAMEQEIVNQGPSNVSRHCADPPGNVVDVRAAGLNQLFVTAAEGRVGDDDFLDERNVNGCYHLQL